MKHCYFVNSDNIDDFLAKFSPKIAIIARPDDYLDNHQVTQLIIETDYGVFTRAYLAEENNVFFVIIYGRHSRKKTTSLDIDYNLTQEAISFLGITAIIGNFVVGGVSDSAKAGSIFILHDFIGLSGYNHRFSPNNNYNFRNKDLFVPFNLEMRDALIQAARDMNLSCQEEGVYGCLVGYPRLETKAEYHFYKMIGCDVVGKTLDPEVTLAHQAGCAYAAVGVTIDDDSTRTELVNNPKSNVVEELIINGRKDMFDIFLNALPRLHKYDGSLKSSYKYPSHEKSTFFYCRPQHR